MATDKNKELPEDVKETQGGNESRPEEVRVKARSQDEKVREEELDPAKPQATLEKEEQMEKESKKPSMERPTGSLATADEESEPARNDPYRAPAPEVHIDPTATAGLDRDQSLGFTREDNEEFVQTPVNKLPDAPHREPSTYTPSGARPGQQNPVNPQGSPGANPLDPAVGARPNESQVVLETGRDGDYTKAITEGEKNASQLPYEIDHQE